MASSNSIDLAIAVPTFIGSLLSVVATAVAISLHIVNPPKRHFRHALIINLLAADFINSLNNTVSGAISLAKGHKDGGDVIDSACIANAWIGQFSVQAVDFNILIISIIVLYTVINNRLVAESSTKATIIICLAAWIPGLITSFIGLGTGAYGHVSGNWCWIKSEFLGLRYGLTHGWRIAIFVATIGIYTYIYIHLKRMDRTFIDHAAENSDTQHILVQSSFAVSHELDERLPRTDSVHEDIPLETAPTGKTTFWSVSADDSSSQAQPGSINKPAQVKIAPNQPDQDRPASKMPAPPNLKKMLMMNGYPIAYILLWLPGMINRLTESVGTSPRWLQALQCSTQFIGFVNAFTYGFSEHLRRVSRRWRKRNGFTRTRG
ncbi:G protein-coupled glucose receptor regulating gpa2 domain-containing protein [Hirsutella rhossiliensis]|uniref:G protein-coupled glucose receptor regulating gpa2 domain-containing protein n=1 Tax=Hirsutella rhossiliensis TaxID=111463 RepID=A0A9P8MTH7_9HYPO|nr:G protein-coupled glucose receptor regulating gpa2 domain-containing protein [Hirsutella rhossiliensis]KAH0958917.1 G protein-coupled glucose receptor regulating gpa2 domain-containing protein [Hirsutella rhossiliensis]